MTGERSLTFDELVDALATVGDEDGRGCRFEPTSSSDPDHHGREFAEALWESIEADRAQLATMLGGIKP